LKNFIYIILIFCLPVAGLCGNADKGKANARVVSAKVTDTYGEALAGSKITVKETGESVFANFEGVFKLSLESGKIYSLTIETIGYQPKEIQSSELSLFSELSLQSL
jgi:hypothetical protein